MKKLWLGICSVVALLVALFGFAACGGQSVTVAFETKEISMKVGDETVLAVTVTGSDETATLTSADPNVVSIGGGYTLIAKSAGTTEVTAKVGSATAVCKVSVTQDDIVGAIALNYEEAELLKGGKITLEANLTYNAQPVAGVTFDWSENSDGAVVSVAANGNTAAVTAVNFGTAKVTVKTTYRYRQIVAEATIRVKDNVEIEVNNLTQESGEYKLALTNNPQSQEEILQFTPSVTVKKNGEAVADAQVSLRLKSGSAQGVIELDGMQITAVKQGTATVELVYSSGSDEYVQEIFVTVKVPVIQATDSLYLEKSVGTKEITVPDMGTVSSVKLGEKTLAFTQEENTVTLSDFAEEDFGEGTLEISADNMIWRSKACVCTKAIGTAADWNAVAATISGNKLDGYYVLTADLDYADTPAPKICFPTWGGTQGFAGTFDGRGHSIKNLTFTVPSGEAVGEGGHSFFGLTSSTAVLRNVAFVNATIDSSANFRAAVVAGFLYGKVENVFVQVTNYSAHSGAIAQSVWSGATISNCVVEQLNEREDSYALCWTSFTGCTIENSYSVGADVLYRNGGDNPVNAPETDTLKGFESFAQMKAASLDLSAFTASVWDTTDGVPVVKGYKDTISADGAIQNNNTAPVKGTLTIQGTGDFVYALKEETDGITIEGSVVTIVGNAGATFTVVATHALYSDITAEKTFTVAELPVVELNGVEHDLSTGALTLTVEGTVSEAFVGDNETTFEQNRNTVTITGATSVAGNAIVTVTTDVNIYNLPVLFITKVITSATDWNTVAATKVDDTLGGYYVLGDDIDFTGMAAPTLCGELWAPEKGFVGTFDGRGYAIKGLSYADGSLGFFGMIGQAGVVKNLAFLNCELVPGAYKSGIVANLVLGTVENVYVSAKNNGSWWTAAFAYYIGGSAVVRNCMIEVTEGENAAFKAALANSIKPNATIENCYAIGAQPLLYVDDAHGEFTETDTLKHFETEADMKAAALDLSGWNTEIWDVSSGIPVFKGNNE